MLARERVLGIVFVLIAVVSLSAASVYGYYTAKPPDRGLTNQRNPLQDIKSLETKAALDPKNPDVLENLANSYWDYASALRDSGELEDSQSYFAKAAQIYQKVLQFRPDKVEVQTDMGTALYYSNQAEKAEEAYEKAVKVDPKYLYARLNYGIFLLDVKGDAAAAREQFTAALQLNPSPEYREKIRSLLAQAADGQVPDYTNDIEPVIFQNCSGCHGPGGVMAKAPLHSYYYVSRYVSPGSADSALLQRMKSGHPVKQKPEEIQLVERWILAGAPGPK